MATLKSLVICAFLTCVGMTFMILACAIPKEKLFYPFFVLIFYVLSVIPVFLSHRMYPGTETNPKTEFALFLTSGMVVSAFALPIVLAHSGVITWLACTFTILSNIIHYLTLLGYVMQENDFVDGYGGMF